eukprot:638166-Rhodomonas_salina.3
MASEVEVSALQTKLGMRVEQTKSEEANVARANADAHSYRHRHSRVRGPARTIIKAVSACDPCAAVHYRTRSGAEHCEISLASFAYLSVPLASWAACCLPPTYVVTRHQQPTDVDLPSAASALTQATCNEVQLNLARLHAGMLSATSTSSATWRRSTLTLSTRLESKSSRPSALWKIWWLSWGNDG